MECITFEGKVGHISLLTHADKIQKLEELMAKNRHTADLFLPDATFYGDVVEPEDPERMADILFKWLGIKHRSLHIHVDPIQTAPVIYTHKRNASQISIGLHVLEDPLLCGAIVAHGIIHHLLIARAKVSLGSAEDDEAFTDLGTIYAGFGILVLNALDSKEHPLGSMGAQNYAAEFIDYCLEQRIVKSLWQPYVLPDIAKQLLGGEVPRQKLKPFIKTRLKKSQSKKHQLVFGIACLTVLLITGAILLATQPMKQTPIMQEKQENITVLRSQYEQCQKLVDYKQDHWDVSDIFIQRQIEADKTRCTSLKNRYNYEISSYNSNR